MQSVGQGICSIYNQNWQSKNNKKSKTKVNKIIIIIIITFFIICNLNILIVYYTIYLPYWLHNV